jgi:hypothetical protein
MPALREARRIEISPEAKILGEVGLEQKSAPFLRPVNAPGAPSIISEGVPSQGVQAFLEIGNTGASRRPGAAWAVVPIALVEAKQPEKLEGKSHNAEGTGLGGFSLAMSLILGMTVIRGKKPKSSEVTEKDEKEGSQALIPREEEPGLIKAFADPILKEFDRFDRGNLLTVAGVLTLAYFTSPFFLIFAGKAGFSLLNRRNRFFRLFEGVPSQKLNPIGTLGSKPLLAKDYAEAGRLRVDCIDHKLPLETRLSSLEKLETLLPRMDPEHPEYRRAMIYLLKLVRYPRLDWSFPKAEQVSQLRSAALRLYLAEVSSRPTEGKFSDLTQILGETILDPSLLHGFIKKYIFKGFPEYLQANDRVRKELLPLYLDLVSELPKNHPQIRRAYRLLREPAVLDLAEADPVFGRRLLKVFMLPFEDFGEVRKTREALSFLMSSGSPFR